MNKILKRISSCVLAIAMCLGITAIVNTTAVEQVVADAAVGDYYSSVTATKGTALLGQLHDLITTTHTTYTTYNNCRDYGTRTDPGLDGKGVLEFYTHETVMNFSGTVGTWNREHVWCQSLSNGMWGTSGGGSDMHHIRPSEASLNSTRGNNKYGVATNGSEAYSKTTSGAKSKLGGYVSGSTFEPLDNVKGDVARIVMYVYTHYNTYSNVGGTTNGKGGSFGTLKFTNVMSASNESAAISLLLEWNKKDPVDEIETYRNEEVFKLQGNRNPFIDNESYADAIWGNGSATPGGDTSDTLTGLSLSPSTLSLNVGASQTLTVTATPSGASNEVSWSSSNSAVASVSNGKVTALSEGSATITATSTKNSSIKATAKVTVTKQTSDTPAAGTATIDINSFSSLSGTYGFYNWTSGDFSGLAYIYGGTTDKMQFNVSQKSYYIASNTSAGIIKSITVKSPSNQTDREWKLLTSTTPYGETEKKPTDGNDRGTKTVTSDGVTWTVDGNDTYFALTYELVAEKGAGYLDSIEITYSEGTEKPVDPPVDPPVTPEHGTVTIDIDSFLLVEEQYAFQNWYADDVRGVAYLNAGNRAAMQFNSNRASHYIASTTPFSAPIKEVTVKLGSGTSKDWKLLTSSTPYGEVSENPTDGNNQGTKSVTMDGTAWTVDGNDTYFALVYEGTGVCYLDSITVTFGEEGDTPVDPPVDPSDKIEGLTINHTTAEFEVGDTLKLSVTPVPSNAYAAVLWSSSDESVAVVSSDGMVTAVKAGTAIITAISLVNPSITASCTVTVKAEDVVTPPDGPVTPPDDPVTPPVTDNTKIKAFRDAVAGIVTKGTLTQRLASINVAINAYKALSDTEKAQVTADTAKLQAAIDKYNEDVNSYNQSAQDTEHSAWGKR